MKLLRPLLVLLAGVIGVIAVLGLLLSLPAVQTRLVRGVVRHRADPSVAIGRVAVGLDRVQLENLRLNWHGAVLTVPRATIDLPLWPALRKKYSIQRLVADGWTLDFTATTAESAKASTNVSRPSPETTLPPPAAFAGFFKLFRLPVDLSIEDAALSGLIISSRADNGTPDRTEITVSGGHFGVGRESEFAVGAKTLLADQTGGAAEIVTKATVATKMTTAFLFNQLRITGAATATGARFPQHEKLDFSCELGVDTAGETYLLELRSLAGAEPKRLIVVNGMYLANSDQVKGTWKCDLRDSDLSSFTLGHRLPAFLAEGEGHFEADRSLSEIHASGRFETTVEKLENIKPAFSILGKVHALSDFDLVQQGSHVQVERLRVELGTEKPVILLQASQKFEVDLQTAELKVAEPTAKLLDLTLTGVPLAWFSPLTGDFAFGGDDAQGTFVVSAREGGFALRPSSPMLIKHFAVSKAGHPLVHPLDLSLSAAADLSPQGWQTTVSDFELRDRETPILSGTLKLGQVAGAMQPVKATGEFRADLPTLATQPLCAGLTVLNRGRGRGTFSASKLGDTTSVAAKVQLEDLSAEAGALPSVTAEVRADLHREGKIETHIPLLLEKDGRVSELQLNSTFRLSGKTGLIDADVTGNTVMLEDLKLFAALTESKAKPNEPASVPAPFWSRIGGPIKIAVKELIYSSELTFRNVSGAARFEPNSLVLEGWRGLFGQANEATANGAISFNSAAQLPYELAANFTVSNLDPAPTLLTIEPGKLPTVDGKFEIVGKVSSSAHVSSEFPDHARVELKLNCRGGKFRGLDLGAGAANLGKTPQGITSKLAGIVALGASVIGRGSTSPAERAKAITETARFLAEINFDQLSLDLLELPSEPIAVRDFSLITPEIRINGTGSIGHVAGNFWARQPLALDLQVSVRGAQADSLRVLGLLKPEADGLGYLPLIERLSLDGTIANVGANSLLLLIQQKPSS